MHSISYTSPDVKAITQKATGEKTLVKALAAVVNREGKKKMPVKKAQIYRTEYV